MTTHRTPDSRPTVPALVAAASLLVVGLATPASAQIETSPFESWDTDFSKATVPLDEIVSGGPPKDGIPAIDDPRFVPVREAAAWIGDREPVMVVEHSGDIRVYPYQILIWHEIVNDEVGGRPLTITYCPLCNTALVFERRFDDMVLDFGTTGRLRHSDLVMYDRQTETWWQQATGEGIVGDLAGGSLAFYPAQTTAWETVRERHPDARVLSRETGHDRPYGRNPYQGYDSSAGPMSRFFSKDVDGRLPAMERVAAFSVEERPLAYPFSALEEHRVVNDRIGDIPFVVWWAPGTASALDAGVIEDGRDVGSSGVFMRTLDGRALEFEPAGDGRFRDVETGSMWEVDGRAVAGPLAGQRLEAIPHGDYLWFAWAAFKPDTDIRGR